MKKEKQVIALTSSGLDSASLMHHLIQKNYVVSPVYVRQGLIWERAELYWLGKYVKAYKKEFPEARLQALSVVDIQSASLYGNHWSLTGKRVPGYHAPDPDVYLPGRNILLISTAAVLAAKRSIHEIALGTLRGNPFPDATPHFFRLLENTLSTGLACKIRIRTPFLTRDKREVSLCAPTFALHYAFSCLAPRGRKACGACNKCREFLSSVLPRRIAHA